MLKIIISNFHFSPIFKIFVRQCDFLRYHYFNICILFQDAIENANLLLEYHISHLKQVNKLKNSSDSN